MTGTPRPAPGRTPLEAGVAVPLPGMDTLPLTRRHRKRMPPAPRPRSIRDMHRQIPRIRQVRQAILHQNQQGIPASSYAFCMPVYPRHKVRAEATTLRWVRENTRHPDPPRVFGFSDTNDNEIGSEWILMTFMEGRPADKRWRGMGKIPNAQKRS